MARGSVNIGNTIAVIFTTADITYYVATTGSDTTGDGTSGNPFKTIQFAFNRLPQTINHTVTINVSAGTYAEDIVIGGFNGKGYIDLKGDTVVSTSRSIQKLQILNCDTPINVTGFNITATTADSIYVRASNSVYISYCNIIASATSYVGANFDYTNGTLEGNTISSKSIAIYSNLNSNIYSVNNSGTSNTTALYANSGGKIAKNGTQPVGTTIENALLGGQIIGSVNNTNLRTPMSTKTASFTLALTDCETVINCNLATAMTITIPTNATANIPVNTEIVFIRYGAGTVTFSPASGVALYSSGGKKSINAQYDPVTLKQISANTWVLVGSLG